MTSRKAPFEETHRVWAIQDIQGFKLQDLPECCGSCHQNPGSRGKKLVANRAGCSTCSHHLLYQPDPGVEYLSSFCMVLPHPKMQVWGFHTWGTFPFWGDIPSEKPSILGDIPWLWKPQTVIKAHFSQAIVVRSARTRPRS